jgi:hypothetical protein
VPRLDPGDYESSVPDLDPGDYISGVPRLDPGDKYLVSLTLTQVTMDQAHLNPGLEAGVDEPMDDELDRQVGLEPVGQHGLLVVNLQDPLLQQ